MRRRVALRLVLAGAFGLSVCAMLTPAVAQTVSLGVYGTTHDLACDATGTVHMIWADQGELSYGTIVGQALVDPRALPEASTVTTLFGRPRLAVSADGTSIHTAWVHSTNWNSTRLEHLWGDGSDWARTTVWQQAADEHLAFPVAAVDGAGMVHIIAQRWYDSPAPPDPPNDASPIVHYWKESAASPWSGPETIEAVSDLQTGPQWRDAAMVSGPDGGIHAVWKAGGRDGRYRFAPAGGPFGLVQDIPRAPHVQTVSFGDLFVDPQGNVHHAFVGYSAPTIEYTVKPFGGIFPESSTVNEGASVVDGDELFPAIGVDSHGHVHIAWAEDNPSPGANDSIKYACSDPSVWTRQDLATDADVDVYGKVSLAVGEDAVYIVWRGNNGELMLHVIEVAGVGGAGAAGGSAGAGGAGGGGTAGGLVGVGGSAGGAGAAPLSSTPGDTSKEDGGCGCRMAGSESQLGWPGLWLLGLLARRRRPVGDRGRDPTTKRNVGRSSTWWLAAMAAVGIFLGGCDDSARPPGSGTGPGGEVLDARCPPGMLFIPAATYQTGLVDGTDQEQPVQEVSVEAYCIGRTEVTHHMYAQCVDVGVCPEPFSLPEPDPSSWYRKCLWGYVRDGLSEDPWGDGSRGHNPVNCVSFEHAHAYCSWAGTRLPTDEEWEYAARGDDGRIFPWGDDESPHERACWFFNPAVTVDVGGFPRGMSPFGVMDMAGNVQEWTTSHTLRGGGWDHCDPVDLHTTIRKSIQPDYYSPMTGFRCAAEASAGGDPVDPNPGGCVPGSCPPNQTCDESCRCQFMTCGAECCGLGEICADGNCCEPDCAGRICGPDPSCGISCGLCTGGSCTEAGACEGGPCPAGMESIPAGTFVMGSEEGWQSERPVHEVEVEAFCMDRTEVTVADFTQCVQAGPCIAPVASDGWWDWSINYLLDGKQEHPMNTLEHVQAEAYCTWAGKRLPTEEEWEYAARGPDSLLFPWGEDAPWGRACIDRNEGTCEVGSYPSGMSPFGMLDMVGNANEWTSSAYCLYTDPGCDDPQRVQRGSNWLDSDVFEMRISKRRAYDIEGWSVNKGVRCAL